MAGMMVVGASVKQCKEGSRNELRICCLALSQCWHKLALSSCRTLVQGRCVAKIICLVVG